MDGFERRREQKKKDILEAALGLFMKYGTQKVSVSEIAQKANVSQVTIYNYFESKDLLINEVLKYYIDKVWDEQIQILDSDLPFNEKLKTIAFQKHEIAHEINEQFFSKIMEDYSAGAGYLEELYTKEALPRLIKLFNEGREMGFVDKSLSDEAIILYIQMFKEFMQRKDIAHRLLPFTDELTHLFYYGIAGKKDE